MAGFSFPLIGVSTSACIELHRPYVKATRYYADSVARAGGHAVYLPVLPDAKEAQRSAAAVMQRLDGLILSGGNDDIQPHLYGEVAHRTLQWINPERDTYELALLEAAFKQQKPVLAICRGMQLLNVYLEGTLYQSLREQFAGAGQHYPDATEMRHPFHALQVKKGSRLHNILGAERIMVNSFHNLGVKDLGKGLTPTAWSEEGIVEAVEHGAYPFVLGVQWHPEAMTQDHAEHLALFTAFVAAASG